MPEALAAAVQMPAAAVDPAFVDKLTGPTDTFLCSLEDNPYKIDFVGFKIRVFFMFRSFCFFFRFLSISLYLFNMRYCYVVSWIFGLAAFI